MRLNDLLIKTTMIDEMVRADHWQGIDECLAIKPKVLKKFENYADAILRTIRQFERQSKNSQEMD